MARKTPKMAAAIELSQQELGQLLAYDPDSGLLRWREKPLLGLPTDRSVKAWNSRFAGGVAGTRKQSSGKQYIQVNIKGRFYPCHRVIWVMVHGSIDQALEIDHINGDGLDNRLVNLRLVSHQDNQKNLSRRSDNQTGVCGVSWDEGRSRWVVRGHVAGKQKNLGRFENFESAVAARQRHQMSNGYHHLHGMDRGKKAASV